MNLKYNIKNELLKGKLIWVLLGFGVLIYAFYILRVSPTLTYDAQPAAVEKILFVSQKILIGILFFLAIINITKIPLKEGWIAWIIFTGLFARIILIPSAPILEDDFYRYLWDGAVTANEFNPYTFSPLQVQQHDSDVPEKISSSNKNTLSNTGTNSFCIFILSISLEFYRLEVYNASWGFAITFLFNKNFARARIACFLCCDILVKPNSAT
jgi:hypothetical protein